MNLYAYAKINWSLSIVSRLPTGYHELDMLMQSVDIADIITLDKSDTVSLSLLGDGTAVPGGQHNLAMRAAALLRDRYKVRQGVAITLRKNIPIGAGLGGGSADAAAVLFGLNRLWSLSVPDDELFSLALSLGADVPFCLLGGLARVRGIGERLTPLAAGPSYPLLIIQPDTGLSTAEVFCTYSISASKKTNPCIDAVQAALLAGDIGALAARMGNALEDAAISMLPEIASCARTLESLGALRAQMTGSGSAVIGLFATRKDAEKAYPHCISKWKRTYLTQTLPYGICTSPNILP